VSDPLQALPEVKDGRHQLLGAKIRSLRKDRVLTLRRLANKTEFSVSPISQIELGKNAASVSTLCKLASALGVAVGVFFEDI